MANTTNLDLVKPAYGDTVDVMDINDNMDKIDAGTVMKNQGAGNAGKFLIVNSSGIVTPTTVPFANGGTY